MSELGSFESGAPDEGGSGASEKASEQARERFAQSQQQAKQQAKDEKRAKKRDDRVAATIRQFMGDEHHAHLYQLISRLVARDCPSIFILSLLSLIHDPAREAVEEFISERGIVISRNEEVQHVQSSNLSEEARANILDWTTRMELIVSIEPVRILSKLMVDEVNMDGSVLQLATFVLVDYFESLGRDVSYEELQPLTIKVLQDILEPHLTAIESYFAEERKLRGGESEDDE